MKVTIKATNLKLTPEVKKAIEEKIATLDKFIPYVGTSVEVFVEVALETRHHKKGKIYYAEANIKVPDKIIRSEAREENIYKAINTVKDELQRLLKEYKKRKNKIMECKKEQNLKDCPCSYPRCPRKGVCCDRRS